MTKEERRIYNREYNKAHRDELLRKKRIYQREYARTHKEQAKAYREAHIEKYKKYSKKYYRENKWLWEEFYNPQRLIKEANELGN